MLVTQKQAQWPPFFIICVWSVCQDTTFYKVNINLLTIVGWKHFMALNMILVPVVLQPLQIPFLFKFNVNLSAKILFYLNSYLHIFFYFNRSGLCQWPTTPLRAEKAGGWKHWGCVWWNIVQGSFSAWRIPCTTIQYVF